MNKTIITELPEYLIFVCIALAFVYAFLLYRKDKKFADLKKTKIWTMAILRFLSVFIISTLLLAPLLKSIKINIEKPIIIYAQDNSESIIANLENKQDTLNAYKTSLQNFISEINKNYTLETFSFGSQTENTLKLNFTDKNTDISELIASVSEKYYNRNVGAVIIASDGIYTKGVNPVYAGKNVAFPIYTVAMGDTTVYSDIILQNVRHNKIAFVGNKFPFQVLVNAKKLKGQTTILNVYNNGKNIFSKEISFKTNDFSKTIDIEIEAEYSGVQQYTFQLSSFENEKNILNNKKVIAIDIINNKQKILIIGNSPHPDIAAIRNALKTNKNFVTEFYTIQDFNKSIAKYNLIILHQIPSKNKASTRLLSEISKKNIPILFIFGTQSSFDNFNALNYGLTIEHLHNQYDETQIINNSNFSLFELDKKFIKLAPKLPPLISPFGNYTLTGSSKTLFYQKIKNIPTNKPLIAFNPENINVSSKIAFITGEGIWRWRLYDFKINNNTENFDNLINQIVQYLAIKINKDRFIVNCKKIINENENINFTAEVYNLSYELINEEDVKLDISNSDGKIFSYVFNKSNMSYYLNDVSLPVGKYKYIAKTMLDNNETIKQGSFTIVPVNIEAQNTIANHQTLFKLASETGGKLFEPNQFSDLIKALQENENIVPISFSNKELTDILNLKWLFFLIVGFLSIEWFLRKFFGSQ